MQTVIIHGRQPKIGRAELESLHGTEVLQPIGEYATGLDLAPNKVDFMRLGGMVKFCKVIDKIPSTNWRNIEKYLFKSIPDELNSMPEGKIKIGLSAYGFNVSPKQINQSGLALKKAIKQTGRSVRLIPNKSHDLNSAQVLYNKLTHQNGIELVLICENDSTIVAKTLAVQDIDLYSKRDQARPKRDAKVGMLPPKLAQIIINLATASTSHDSAHNKSWPYSRSLKTVLDPFCGTGVLLQEAALSGYDIYGTDIDPRMIDYSKENLDWLAKNLDLSKVNKTLSVGDATTKVWDSEFDFVASEIYLGKPLSIMPDSLILDKITPECEEILSKFLENLSTQTKPGFRLCVAVPCWKTKSGFQHLLTLDKLEDLGYNRLKFKFSSNDDLIYHRTDQVVARELVVLERT